MSPIYNRNAPEYTRVADEVQIPEGLEVDSLGNGTGTGGDLIGGGGSTTPAAAGTGDIPAAAGTGDAPVKVQGFTFVQLESV